MEEKKEFAFCPYCGMKYSRNSSNGYCLHCGAKFDNEKKEEIEPVPEKETYQKVPPALIAAIIFFFALPAIGVFFTSILLFGPLGGMEEGTYDTLLSIGMLAFFACIAIVPIELIRAANNAGGKKK